MPSPVGLVVKNGWNSLSLMSAEMPMPLSRTRISTASPASRVVTFSVGSNPASAAVTRPPRGRVEAVAEEVQEDPRHVLRVDLDRRDAVAEIPFQRDIETLILCAGAVVGEVQRLIDQRVQIDHAPFARGPARMFQHRLHDAVGTFAVLGDLRQITLEGRRQFVDLGLPVACDGIVQFAEQVDRIALQSC